MHFLPKVCVQIITDKTFVNKKQMDQMEWKEHHKDSSYKENIIFTFDIRYEHAFSAIEWIDYHHKMFL